MTDPWNWHIDAMVDLNVHAKNNIDGSDGKELAGNNQNQVLVWGSRHVHCT